MALDLSDIDDLKTAMKLAGLKAQKSLGQHFLVDRESLEQIVEAGNLFASDTVLEVGPGLGVLTQELSKRAGKVIAVEQDRTLAELLERQKLKNVEVEQADIRQYDLGKLPPGYKVVSNIPYYLTSFLIQFLLESSNPPSLMVLLIQKEVAERITAKPGNLSILALSVQYYAEAQIAGLVGRDKFWPPPQVDSAILKVRMRPNPAFEADRGKLFRLVHAGFGEKRKQLKNSLAGGLGIEAEKSLALLKSADIDPTLRAEALAISDWQRLYEQAANQGII